MRRRAFIGTMAGSLAAAVAATIGAKASTPAPTLSAVAATEPSALPKFKVFYSPFNHKRIEMVSLEAGDLFYTSEDDRPCEVLSIARHCQPFGNMEMDVRILPHEELVARQLR